jgi:hypothetical protein
LPIRKALSSANDLKRIARQRSSNGYLPWNAQATRPNAQNAAIEPSIPTTVSWRVVSSESGKNAEAVDIFGI